MLDRSSYGDMEEENFDLGETGVGFMNSESEDEAYGELEDEDRFTFGGDGFDG